MRGLSDKEIEILLLLAKDISVDYNAHNISGQIGITHAGAFKAMKHLERKKLITGKRMGKAVFYRANLEDYYAFRVIETLLIDESREKAGRWLFEFRDLFGHAEAAVIFGSIVRDAKRANDIDLLLVFKKEKNKIINKLVEERRAISDKAIHLIKQTPDDLIENLKKKDKVILNALRNGYVLHGYEKLLRAINAARI